MRARCLAKCQKGLTTVEFAVIGSLLMLVTFGLIEIGRLLFTYSVLAESTRRAARVAAVCFPDAATLTRVQGLAAFGQVPGLAPSDVALDYLDANGTAIGDPGANFLAIRYVRVRLVDFSYQMYIPFVSSSLNTPDFAVTLPRESLGVPRDGVIQPC